MSVQCKIHCCNCENDYYVYWPHMSKENIVNCPHCDAKMDSKMWANIIDAVGNVWDVNYHFRKYNSERDEDQFYISVENVEVPQEKFRFSE